MFQTFVPFLKDYGSDPIIGIISAGVFIVIMVIWGLIDESSMTNFMLKNNYKYGESGLHRERNQRRRHQKRASEIARLKAITVPNYDDKYIYIMESMGLYKVGISNNVIYRRQQIEKELKGQYVEILYIGSVRYGRTIDAEQIIHRELKPYNINVEYRRGVNSVEWFSCSLSTIINITNDYADLQKL